MSNTQKRYLKFVKQAREIHGDRYDYTNTDVSKADGKYAIVCPVHGEFLKSRVSHIQNKSGCSKCSYALKGERSRLGIEEFIEKSKGVHGSVYSYQNVVYKDAHTKVSITCPKHGDFLCTPANHWSNGVGCPSCLASNPTKGEARVAAWLESSNFEFSSQKTFKDLFHQNPRCKLRFDFFIESINTLIEYDGEHHFIPMRFAKEQDPLANLASAQLKDRLKDEYARSNNIRLIRIRYDEDIESVLKSALTGSVGSSGRESPAR